MHEVGRSSCPLLVFTIFKFLRFFGAYEMQPDLSPHLHTVECNFLIQLFKQCLKERKVGMSGSLPPIHTYNPFAGKFVGACNYWDEAVWQCTRKERIWRRFECINDVL